MIGFRFEAIDPEALFMSDYGSMILEISNDADADKLS